MHGHAHDIQRIGQMLLIIDDLGQGNVNQQSEYAEK